LEKGSFEKNGKKNKLPKTPVEPPRVIDQEKTLGKKNAGIRCVSKGEHKNTNGVIGEKGHGRKKNMTCSWANTARGGTGVEKKNCKGSFLIFSMMYKNPPGGIIERTLGLTFRT